MRSDSGSIHGLIERVIDQNNFIKLSNFLDFAGDFLQCLKFDGQDAHRNVQATIVAGQNQDYRFFQYDQEANFCVTRPINSKMMLSETEFFSVREQLEPRLKNIRSLKGDGEARKRLNRLIYTCQQSVGCTLDARNNPNGARKLNGEFFERLVRLVINACGLDCATETQTLLIPGTSTEFKFQHDAVLKDALGTWKAIGQIKTSTKDRLDKVFMDRLIYEKVSNLSLPYFLVVLNDVQRGNKKGTKYSLSGTFLPGHYKAYTLAFSPLSGVYYLDRTPAMLVNQDKVLQDIKTLDELLVEDMWNF